MLTQLIFAAVAAGGAKHGTVVMLPDFSSKVMGNTRKISVYLPPGYEEDGKETYPVVYFHDGQNVFDGDRAFIKGQEWRADETADALIGAGLMPPAIMVGIDNAGAARGDEYLWTRATFQGHEMGGRGPDYLTFVLTEVMPMIEKGYRVKRGPENTALIGSSFGGLITLSMGLARPDVFGKLGVCSPSIWWDGREILKRISSFDGKARPKVWLDAGTGEGEDTMTNAAAALEALRRSGWSSNHSILYVEDGAQHNERAWAGRLPLLLRWLFENHSGEGRQ